MSAGFVGGAKKTGDAVGKYGGPRLQINRESLLSCEGETRQGEVAKRPSEWYQRVDLYDTLC